MSGQHQFSTRSIQEFLDEEGPLQRLFVRVYAEPKQRHQSFQAASAVQSRKTAFHAIQNILFPLRPDPSLLHGAHEKKTNLAKFSAGDLAVGPGPRSDQCDVPGLLGEARGKPFDLDPVAPVERAESLSVQSESATDSHADCHFHPKALSVGSDVVRDISPHSPPYPDSDGGHLVLQQTCKLASVQPTGPWQHQIPLRQGSFVWQRWILPVRQSLLRHRPVTGEQSSGNKSSGNKSSGNKSSGNKSSGNKSSGNKSSGNKSSYGSVSGSQLEGSSASPSRRDQAGPNGNGDEDEETGDGDTGGSGDGEGDPQGGTSPGRAAPPLACPYYKRNPHMYLNMKSCCASSGWREFHRVKEHIYRNHAPLISCRRCWATFKSQTDLERHLLLAERCPIRAGVVLEGCIKEPKVERCTKEQEEALRKKVRDPKRSREDKWADVYKILFPDDEDIPSPYYEVWGDVPEQELAQLEGFVQREVLREIQQPFEDFISQLPTQYQQNFRTTMGTALKDAHRKAFEQYRRERQLPSPAVALSPSSAAAIPPGALEESEGTRGDSLSNQGNTEVTSETTNLPALELADFDFPTFWDQTSTANEEFVKDNFDYPLDLDLRPNKRVKYQLEEGGQEAIGPFFLDAAEGQGAAGFSTENESEGNYPGSPSDLLPPEEDTDSLGRYGADGV